MPKTEFTTRTCDRAPLFFPRPTRSSRSRWHKNSDIGTAKDDENITFEVHDNQNVTKVVPRRTPSVIKIDPIKCYRKFFVELLQVIGPV